MARIYLTAHFLGFVEGLQLTLAVVKIVLWAQASLLTGNTNKTTIYIDKATKEIYNI
jgi:hypothetical protein